MSIKDKLQVVLLIPIIIGGAIALMAMSYLLVPVLIVSFVAFISYSIVSSKE
jgi:hypothetical protein